MSIHIPSILAQPPGYLGKRFIGGYGFYFSPAILGTTAKGKTIVGRNGTLSETKQFAFNSQHQIYAEYVLKEHLSIGTSLTYYKTMQANGYPSYSSAFISPYDITGMNYNFYFKVYFKNRIAPWGKYVLGGLTLNTTKSTYDPSKVVYAARNYYYLNGNDTDFGPAVQKYKRLDLLLGIGHNRIFYDKITLDYGINIQAIGFINALYGPEGAELFENVLEIQKPFEAKEYIHRTSTFRNREVNKFNVFLKFGVLIF